MSLRAAVLGHPISHSKSPALHHAAYSRLGIGISYTAIDVTEQLLPSLMRQLRDQPGWRGLSVTMPLKTAMVAEVDEVRGVARTQADAHRMKRPAYADEVAAVIAFLCADESRWINGVNLPVDGGLASTYV